jgi:3'-phosphoadenosine 5'-phosphosulfate sulfotransferase (PAPS reductase)/FAD synthetase
MTTEEIIMACGLGIGVKKVYGLCSGGKDSMTACATAHKIRPLDGIILIDTTVPAMNGDDKPTYIAAKRFAEQLGVPFICIKPMDNLRKGFEYVPCIGKYGEGAAYENYCKKYGMPHAGQHNQVYRYLKGKAMLGFIMSQTKSKERIAFISGAREAESDRRAENTQMISIGESPRLIWICPVYYWTTEQAFKFCEDNDYRISEAYKWIHTSGDCMCGAFAAKDEVHMVAMAYPDTAKKIARIEAVANIKHKGKEGWGNSESMLAALSQSKLERRYGCECEQQQVEEAIKVLNEN